MVAVISGADNGSLFMPFGVLTFSRPFAILSFYRKQLEQGAQLEKTYYVELKYNSESIHDLSFGIMFMDCFSNEYIQTFEISVESSGSASISCNYPQLTLAALK